MSFVPLRMRPLGGEQVLCVHDTGHFFTTTPPFLERFAADKLSPIDHRFLNEEGHALAAEDGLGHASYLYGLAERAAHAGPLDYLILVPTLRCNLSCSYCQVSRAGLKQPGFD